MRISIFGLGYVGAVSLACLARDGHQVIGVDVDATKVDLVRAGRSPIVEAGMQALVADAIASGWASATTDTTSAVHDTDVSFLCVGTPARPNGRQDLSAIERLSGQLGEALAAKDGYHLVVVRSTVYPGTVDGFVTPLLEKHSNKRAGEDFDVCFQPEFLREGSSVKDYDDPPFTIVGASTARGADVLRELFGQLPGDYIVTDLRTAEMLKYACNLFHALKITFANEIGRLAQPLDVDPHAVMDLVCCDTRLNISRAYLKPGFAFGGSCLPKDLKAMLYLAKTHDVLTPMLSGILPSNQIHIDHAIDRVLATGKRRVGLIGLSFKSGTDDLRESPLVLMAERFIGKGLALKVYDPQVQLSHLIGANRRYIEETIPHIASLMTEDCAGLVEESDVVVVGLNDDKVLTALRRHTRGDQLLLDLVRLPSPDGLAATYQGVCW